MAEAIDGFIADPARAAEVGKAARERVVEHFLGTRSLLQYMDLIAKLLASEDA